MVVLSELLFVLKKPYDMIYLHTIHSTYYLALATIPPKQKGSLNIPPFLAST